MRGAGALLAAALLWSSPPAPAHHAPNSYLRLDFRADSVLARMMIPRSELAFAMGDAPTEAALPGYLLKHIAAATPHGAAWAVKVSSVHATNYLEQPYFTAELELLPPLGASPRNFTLTADAVTHEVRNHVVVVVVEHDAADAAPSSRAHVLGALQYPARSLVIDRRRPSPAL